MQKVKFTKTLIIIISIITLFSSFAEASNEIAYVNGNYVNIRKSPDIKSESYGFLLIGTEVIILNKSDQKQTINNKTDYWYLCRIEACDGWVFGSFITKGKFDRDNFLNKIPKLSNIPEEYYELVNNFWTNCTQQESDEGGMDCCPVKFTENLIINQFIPCDTYYQILDIKSENDLLGLKIRMIMSEGFVTKKYHDYELNISGLKGYYNLKIKFLRDQNGISLNGEKLYKNKKPKFLQP